jgi:hypothetical protein
MADQSKAEYDKKKRRLAELEAELQKRRLEWAKEAGDGKNARDTDIEHAIEWSGEGWVQGGGIAAIPDFLPGGEEDQRKNFRDITLLSGKKRAQVMREYDDLRKERDALSKEIGAAVANDPEKVVTDDNGKVLGTRNANTGQTTGAFDASSFLQTRDTDGQRPKGITSADLEDIFRTAAPDITPGLLADLYPEYDAEGQRINQVNPSSWAEAKLVNYDNTEDPGVWAAEYRKEITRKATENRRLNEKKGNTRTGMNGPNVGGRQGSPSAAAAVSDQGGRRGSPGQSAAAVRASKARADVLTPGEKTVISFREAFALPLTWAPTKVAQMATQLFQAGYMPQLMNSYDPTKPLSQQYPGSMTDPYNPMFRNAYMQWMKDAQMDRSKTAVSLLNERVQSNTSYFQEMKRVVDEAKAKEKAEKIQAYTRLSDPDMINQLADELGQATLGRKIDPHQRQALIDFIHGQQTSYGSQRAAAEMGEGSMPVDIDVEASLLAKLKAEHPTEAMAKDVADQYDNFRQLIGGPLGQM